MAEGLVYTGGHFLELCSGTYTGLTVSLKLSLGQVQQMAWNYFMEILQFSLCPNSFIIIILELSFLWQLN